MTHLEPLFFENAIGKERVVDEVANLDDAFAAMRRFCDERNFKIPYVRFLIEEYPMEESVAWRISFDVGSWSEFFYIYFDTFEDASKFLINKK